MFDMKNATVCLKLSLTVNNKKIYIFIPIVKNVFSSFTILLKKASFLQIGLQNFKQYN